MHKMLMYRVEDSYRGVDQVILAPDPHFIFNI